jgi:hypothetical protein
MLRISTRTSETIPVQQEKTTKAERIPKTLQAVFLASNRGNDVHTPPPKHVAFKTFFRSLIGGRKNRSNDTLKNNNKTLDDIKPSQGKKKSNTKNCSELGTKEDSLVEKTKRLKKGDDTKKKQKTDRVKDASAENKVCVN